MEGDAVEGADHEEGPVGADFCVGGVAVVVDGDEDVGGVGEGGEGVFEGEGIGCEDQHLRHGWPEEVDVCVGIGFELFVFEVSG